MAAFSLSGLYNEIQTATSVHEQIFVDEKTECKTSAVTYKEDLAIVDNFSITREFAAAVCQLPDVYDDNKYEAFLDHWGTHVVMEATFGQKYKQRFETDKASIFNHVTTYAPHLISQGPDMSEVLDAKGFSGSIAADHTIGALHYSITETADMPTGVSIEPISDALTDKYWMDTEVYSNIHVCELIANQRHAILANVRIALLLYTTRKSTPIISDVPLTWTAPATEATPAATTAKPELPLVWPSGTYGLPKARTGCPNGWSEGWISEDTEDDYYNAWGSNAPNLLAGQFSVSSIQSKFCVKPSTIDSQDSIAWPSGTYCILRKLVCPNGFSPGSIYFDDEDDSNGNRRGGTLPDGTFDGNTRLDFCCRRDNRGVRPNETRRSNWL